MNEISKSSIMFAVIVGFFLGILYIVNTETISDYVVEDEIEYSNPDSIGLVIKGHGRIGNPDAPRLNVTTGESIESIPSTSTVSENLDKASKALDNIEKSLKERIVIEKSFNEMISDFSKSDAPMLNINLTNNDQILSKISWNYLAPNNDILRVESDGSIFWKGREVETDDDFKKIMLDLMKNYKKCDHEY